MFVAEACSASPACEARSSTWRTVCATAQRHLAGFGDRAAAVPGDMFAGDWPGADVVLLSQILHDWPMATGQQLLAHAHAALPPGGRVLVHEKLVEDDGGPLANALVTVDMLVWTDGQQMSRAGVATMLREAGFSDIAVHPTVGYWSVVEGTR